jgi:hypothetical protein
MKFQKTLGALAALATIALASAADAAIVYTYKGAISGGTDYAGLLGGPLNQALDGKAFTLTFTLDPTSPDFLQSFFPGGESAGVPSGSTGMTGVISIDGVSLDLLLTDDAVVIESQMVDPPYASSIFHEYFGVEPVSDGSGDIYMEWAWVQVYSENGNQIVPTPVSYASPFTYTVQPGDVVWGQFMRSRHDDEFSLGDMLISATLATTSISVVDTSAGAVPEPATWALMIAGFGAAGSALRRRRPVAA